MAAPQPRTRNFSFTLNNYTDEDIDTLQSWEGHKQVRYLIFEKEVGENTHTPHLQGFIMFHNPKTFDQCVRFFNNPRFHIEISKGSAHQNIAYCSKEGDYIEFGDKPAQGTRADILQVVQQIQNNVPINEVIFQAPSYQAARHAELLMKYQRQPLPVQRRIKWYYGPTGTGKTRTAIEESNGDFYITMRNLKWWNGYVGQGTIIIDDFRKDFCTFHELLRILDRYPYQLEIKGSSIWMQPMTHTIIITSAYHPAEVYQTREDVSQLLRRIDEIREFK